MKNQFVPYKIAKQLIEKDFDEPCICVYKKGVKNTVYPVMSNEPSYPFKTVKNSQTGSLHFSAPLYQQVIDWFLEKHNIVIEVIVFSQGWFEKDKFSFQWRIYNNSEEWITGNEGENAGVYKTKGEPFIKAIEKAITLI